MFKKVIAPIIISATLLGGVAIAGNAYASAPATSAQAAPHSAAASTESGAQLLRAWLRAHRRQIRRAGVAISARTIGVTPQDLVTELRSGKSIADVAAEHDVSAQTVVDALVAAADSKINHSSVGPQAEFDRRHQDRGSPAGPG